MSATWHGRDWIDLGTQLLDRQIVDPGGVSAGKVDDLELSERDDGRVVVSQLLVGDRALAGRMRGTARRLISLVLRLIGESGSPQRIALSAVLRVGSAVMVTETAAGAALSPVEDRLRTKVIERIPGSGRASV